MNHIEDFLTVNHTRLFCSISGEGEPLVLVHGGFTDHRVWKHQSAAFASQYKVVCLDQRGYGKSDLPLGPFSHMEDLKSLLDVLQLSKVNLIGSSLGGAVALEFALQYPEAVKSLVLVGSGLKGYPYPPDYLASVMELPGIIQAQGIEAGINYILTSPLWDYFFPSPNHPEARASVVQLVKDSVNVFRWNPMWDVALDPSAYERLGEIKIPVLMIIGDRDSHYVMEIGDYIHGKIENSGKVMMKDCCHHPFVEKPQEFNRLVQDFLTK